MQQEQRVRPAVEAIMTRGKAKPAFDDCTEQKRLNDAREQGVAWK